MAEYDAGLRRLERSAVVACAAMAAAAASGAVERVAAAAGVLAGGVLVMISYRGIKGGLDAVASGATVGGTARRRVAIGLVKFFTRYGILAAVAYVTVVRWRLPPVAVVAGASSLVVAAMVEAVRPRRAKPPATEPPPTGCSVETERAPE